MNNGTGMLYADFIVCNGVYEPIDIIDTAGPDATQAVLEGFGFPRPEKGVLAVSCIRLIIRLAFLLSVPPTRQDLQMRSGQRPSASLTSSHDFAGSFIRALASKRRFSIAGVESR